MIAYVTVLGPGGGNDSATIIGIAVGVTLGVLIIIAIVIIVLLLLYKKGFHIILNKLTKIAESLFCF